MTKLRRARTCQGNFAASVKGILPIDEADVLAAVDSIGQLFRRLPKICGERLLTRRPALA